MNGGDPTVLADAGNDLMGLSIRMDEGRTPVAGRGSMPTSALGELASGSGVSAAYAAAHAAVINAAQNLQSTVSEDGHIVQRGARDIDTVTNRCTTRTPRGGDGSGPRMQ